MKNIFKAIFCSIIIAAAFCTTVNAQGYKTDESISSQIKKGTVPGQKFKPETKQLQPQKEVATPNANIKEKFSVRLKNGTLPGFRAKQGGSATSFKANTTAKKTTGSVNLASNNPAKKQENAQALKPVTLPTQDAAPAAKQ